MVARTKPYPEAWREHVDAKGIRDRLQNHVLGDTKLSATQINAARVLLAKVVPDLKAIEHSGDVTTRHAVMTDDELRAALAEQLEALRDGGAL